MTSCLDSDARRDDEADDEPEVTELSRLTSFSGDVFSVSSSDDKLQSCVAGHGGSFVSSGLTLAVLK